VSNPDQAPTQVEACESWFQNRTNQLPWSLRRATAHAIDGAANVQHQVLEVDLVAVEPGKLARAWGSMMPGASAPGTPPFVFSARTQSQRALARWASRMNARTTR
jgi:hypothetical protein